MSNFLEVNAVTHSPVAIAAPCRLTEEARQLLREDLSPQTYFELLRKEHLYVDAIQFMAHRLPKREAVWWGCLCVWKVSRPHLPQAESVALQAAVHWVLDPSENNRRAAEATGQAAGVGTPSGCVALAAFWSDGSLSPRGLPEVAPPPFLTARTIAGALCLAAVLPQADKQTELQGLFLRLANEVANGKNHWTVAPKRCRPNAHAR
jgi:hypothetical protein